MKVLQLSYKVPFPQHDGGSYSIFNSAMNMIDAGMKVKTLAMNSPKDWVETKDVFNDFQNETQFESVYTDTRVKPFHAALNLLKKDSYFIERFYSREFEQKIADTLLRNRYDVILMEHLYLCPYIDLIRAYSDAKIILRAQNVEHRIWEKYIGGIKNPFSKLFLKIATNRLKKYECNVVDKLDGIIALTAEDAAFFKYKTSSIPVTEIPVGFEKNNTVEPSHTSEKLPVLFHLGSMDWLPNVEAMDWFIGSVLPIIVKKYPDIKLHIAGKKMPEWYSKMNNKNLIVDGRIASAKNYMRDKDILIVPLLSGGGIRVKIIEAMAYGKTVISTSVGVKGIHLQNNINVLLADTAEGFAQQIFRCIESEELRFTIAENGYKLANANYNSTSLSQKLTVFYQEVLRKVNEVEEVVEPAFQYQTAFK